ncbi:MAG: ATPase, T2SS/T4P/T4SS family [Rhodospirillales bacterium]|nr:ATPase, T2SS/T4P/T4SS family [Rhodospirillales bacterium]
MTPRWPDADHAFPAAGLDCFLLWAADLGASDISFQTGAPAFVEIDGVLHRATGARLDSGVIERLSARIFDNTPLCGSTPSGVSTPAGGGTADGILRSGKAIDCSYAVASGPRAFRRFRCNLSPVLAGQRFGINITMRVLPDTPPSLEELGIEPEVAEAWDLCRGLTLVTGVPGSGKSTLLAAGTRRLLESGAGRVQSYEAPIEFVFDGIGGDGALMSSSEVPRHFPSFADGLRASLRRRPAAVVVGEARDRETVEAVVRAADFGIAVFATAHTVGVAAAIRRLLAEFPAAERQERGAALIDVMTLAVTQVLLPNPQCGNTPSGGRAPAGGRTPAVGRTPSGGRTAIREWLRFDGGLKARLLDAPQERWSVLIAEALRDTGNDLAASAERAFREGRIGEGDRRRTAAGSAGPRTDGRRRKQSQDFY